MKRPTTLEMLILQAATDLRIELDKEFGIQQPFGESRLRQIIEKHVLLLQTPQSGKDSK